MPKTTKEWLEELEKIFEREAITEEEYKKQTEKAIPTWQAFSKQYPTPENWQAATTATSTPYKQRIERYLLKHPTATLKEARGHG